jgi:predicted MFS family arabinose efflux permease
MKDRIRSAVQAPELAQASAGSARRTFWLFVMLYLLYMVDYIDRQVVSSLFPFLKADLGISDTQAGLLISAVYWSIVVFAFPVSILIDRWSRRKSIGIMVAVWSVATGLAVFAKSFSQLLLTRFGVGVGEAGYSPGGTAMISAMYPAHKRSRMMGIWSSSLPLGAAIGVTLGGFIATRWGWKHAFGIVALPGLLLAVLFYFYARDYRTIKLEAPVTGGAAARRLGWKEIAREFLRTPSLLLTYLAFAGNTFVTTSYVNWLPSYFNRYDGIPMGPAGLRSSVAFLFAIVGAPLGGILVDRWLRRRGNARPLFAGLTSLLSAAIWLVAFWLLRGTLQFILLCAGGITTVLYVSAAAAITQDVVHPGVWAISYSICVIVQNFLGSSLGPLFVGAMSDRYGLRTAMLFVPIGSVLAGLLFLAASRFYARDLAKVAKVKVEVA